MQVRNIMTPKVMTLKTHQTLYDAHQVTSQKGIRHMPVMDSDSGELVGIVTQKALLSRVMVLVGQVGAERLEAAEMQTPITQVMHTDYQTLSPDQALSEAGEYFLQHKHGCLPVIENGQLVGIVSSSDFVRLSLSLLREVDRRD